MVDLGDLDGLTGGNHSNVGSAFNFAVFANRSRMNGKAILAAL